MKLEDLPTKIPVFPLSNFIIFPKTTVPLNIFEPRYVDMIKDNHIVTNVKPKILMESNNFSIVAISYDASDFITAKCDRS